jgi:hypothetical protein
MSSTKLRIGVVGPCKSGKTTLVRGLQLAGYDAIQIAQEHSFAPRMWRQIAKPDVLVYLHCSFPTTVARGLGWLETEFDEQQPRLVHARRHADIEIITDALNPKQVLAKVVGFLQESQHKSA